MISGSYSFLFTNSVKMKLLTSETIIELLRLFGATTGLHTNILKSEATPIRCSD
jgi:hypothetical protein